MFLLFILAPLTAALICAYYYFTASPEHRAEHLNIYIYFATHYTKLPFSISRAYDPLIDKFRTCYIGLCSEFVCVIVRNNHKEILVGKRSKKKYYNFDVGACGMVQYNESSLQAAKRELKEELGLDKDLTFLHKCIPYYGYTGICSVYEVTIDEEINLLNTDGTYFYIQWTKNLKDYKPFSSEVPIFNYNMYLLVRDKLL